MDIEAKVDTNLSWADQMDIAPALAPTLTIPDNHNIEGNPPTFEFNTQNRHMAQLPLTDEALVPIIPLAILYDINNHADPILWDSSFGAISLFGTLEFFPHDSTSVICSLQCIGKFIQQQNIKDQDLQAIPQLKNFAEVAWECVSAVTKK